MPLIYMTNFKAKTPVKSNSLLAGNCTLLCFSELAPPAPLSPLEWQPGELAVFPKISYQSIPCHARTIWVQECATILHSLSASCYVMKWVSNRHRGGWSKELELRYCTCLNQRVNELFWHHFVLVAQVQHWAQTRRIGDKFRSIQYHSCKRKR